MIVLIKIQDAFTTLSLWVILIVSACFYMDMNCFRPVRVVSGWLRVDSIAADGFGWLVEDGFGWFAVLVVTLQGNDLGPLDVKSDLLTTRPKVFQIALRGWEIGNFARGDFFTRCFEPGEE